METTMQQEQTNITAAMHMRVSGEYSAEVRHADGTVTEIPWFKNLILDSGLDDLGTMAGLRNYCHVGTGTSTPVVTQVALDAKIGTYGSYASATTTQIGAPSYAWATTLAYTFAIGAIVGNITEVGVGATISGTRLYSRARFTDGGGNPIAITVTASDQLVVYHKVTVTPPITDGTGSVVISGTTYNYTTRLLYAGLTADRFENIGVAVFTLDGAATVYGSNAALSAITASAPTGTAIGNDSGGGTYSTYVPGTYYRDTTVVWSPTVANDAGGIKGFRVTSSCGNFQIILNTPIMKTNLQQLTMVFRRSWGR
jgi:hypothetical protein